MYFAILVAVALIAGTVTAGPALEHRQTCPAATVCEADATINGFPITLSPDDVVDCATICPGTTCTPTAVVDPSTSDLPSAVASAVASALGDVPILASAIPTAATTFSVSSLLYVPCSVY